MFGFDIVCMVYRVFFLFFIGCPFCYSMFGFDIVGLVM